MSSTRHGPGGPADDSSRRLNTLGLSARELDSVARRLDKDPSAAASARRTHTRMAYRVPSVSIRLTHPGGTVASFPVACRNLSGGGASLLHSAFVHPGTDILVTLPNLRGQFVTISGRVVRCRHADRMVHDLGVAFARPINVREFIPESNITGATIEHVDGDSVSGTVVLAEPAPLDQGLFKHFLRVTEVRLRPAPDAAKALALAREDCDLVVSAARLGRETCADLAAMLLGEGIRVPLIVVGPRDDDCRTAARAAGAVAYLERPVAQVAALRAIAEAIFNARNAAAELAAAKAAQSGEPDPDPPATDADPADVPPAAMHPMLVGPVRTLDEALNAGDTQSCYIFCSIIRDTALAAELDAIAKLAEAAGELLSSTASLGPAAPAIEKLLGACGARTR